MKNYIDISKYLGNFLPTQDIDITDQCFVMLKNAIDKNEICNIAITGQYGSGKSSYVKSYISRYKNNNLILVSLSKFNFGNVKKQNIDKDLNNEKD